MTDIQVWLDQGKTLADQATEGPWEARSSEATMNDRAEWKIGKHNRPQALRSVMRGSDAAFIADARTRLPQALAALQAVLDMHRPSTADTGEEEILFCPECFDVEDVGEVDTWPCPTVQAIQNALGTDA